MGSWGIQGRLVFGERGYLKRPKEKEEKAIATREGRRIYHYLKGWCRPVLRKEIQCDLKEEKKI